MKPFHFFSTGWENSQFPTIVQEDEHGGDYRILAVLKRVHNPDALHDLCRLANEAIEAGASPPPPPRRSAMADLTTKAAEIRAGLEAIEHDPHDHSREYIPLPGGWEIQTKGAGSTYRLLDKKTGERHAILAGKDWFNLQAFFTRFAHEVFAASRDEREQQAAELADEKGARETAERGGELILADLEQARAELAAERQRSDYLRVQRDGHAANLATGEAQYGVLEQQNKHLLARATTAESERDSWRRVCERLETEKQAALAERDELLREKERLEAALQKLHDAASVFHNAALVHLSDTTFDSDGGLSEADAELSVNALPGARSALENGPAGLADAHPKSPDQPERDTGPRFNERAGSEIAAQRQQEEREPNGHRKNSCSEPGGNSRPLGEE